MVNSIFGAAMRAFLVWVLIATPSLLLPGGATHESQLTVLFAVLAAFFVFVEYYSNYPSIIEFRFAAPYNRLRFFTVFTIVLLLSLACKGKTDTTGLSLLIASWANSLGHAFDLPFSPVRLVVLMLHEEASPEMVNAVRSAAALSYALSLTGLLIFFLLIRFANWPTRAGAFNVWVNLPLFDPTGGGDVLARLKRDAAINVILGFLLPFVIPAVVKMATDLVSTLNMSDPQMMIWTMTAWAFLPTSLIMRGIAMGRIAEMIEEKRKRAYAQSQAPQTA